MERKIQNTEALQTLLAQRQNRPFVSIEEIEVRLEALIAAKKRIHIEDTTAPRAL